MGRQSYPAAPVPVHPKFNAPDADFTIHIITQKTQRKDPFDISRKVFVDFKVHKHQLSQASSVFETMFEQLPDAGDAGPSDRIQLECHFSTTWCAVLACAYDDQELFDKTLATAPAEAIQECWEIAYRYQIRIGQLLCDLLMR